jgi:hypothetical protein
MIGIPPTGCNTFGIAERMRVPSPAARTIVSNSVIAQTPASPPLRGGFPQIYGGKLLGKGLMPAAMVNCAQIS